MINKFVRRYHTRSTLVSLPPPWLPISINWTKSEQLLFVVWDNRWEDSGSGLPGEDVGICSSVVFPNAAGQKWRRSASRAGMQAQKIPTSISTMLQTPMPYQSPKCRLGLETVNEAVKSLT